MAANAFFEHVGLVGAFALVAWDDLQQRLRGRPLPAPARAHP
jgi:hypothetical protein